MDFTSNKKLAQEYQFQLSWSEKIKEKKGGKMHMYVNIIDTAEEDIAILNTTVVEDIVIYTVEEEAVVPPHYVVSYFLLAKAVGIIVEEKVKQSGR